ncbi:MAG: hypothetical protein A2283_00500 [Lentisphaerae bacterium RIFOXYA12_FULL_48_11]|nr:MAG: hypothetical protein A2283_00500 [Lentisphaerae bacterium RIFOXYA12_FULL_48_11]
MRDSDSFFFVAVATLATIILTSQQATAFEPVKTRVIKGGDAPLPVVADITGVKDLFLVATIGNDTYNYDQAIWANPKLFDKDGKAVDLSDLKPHKTQVGWGMLLVNTGQGQQPLNIHGKSFTKGFWAHAPSILHFKLDGKYTRFEAQVGIDAVAGRNGSSEFLVTDIEPKLPKPKLPRTSPAPVTENLSPADRAPHHFNAEAAKVLRDKGIEKLIFVRRFTLTCSHVYTEHIDSRWTPGGGLCILDLKTGAVSDLVPQFGTGVVNRFDLSFDAKKIVFDYKRSAREGYRIYEINIDGSNLRQLTFPEDDEADLVRLYGYGSNDMQPCYLPDGNIIFTSTRCRTSTLCNGADVYTTTVLYRMDSNGSNIRRLSFNPVSEFSPAVLPDGRVLYMRWEYNRKGAGAVKCLWAMHSDGTGTSEVYGNNIIDPETMLYGRPIPGTVDKICFLGCSHWGPNNGVGTVVVIDTREDTRNRETMKLITKDVDAQTHGGFTFRVDNKWVNESTGEPGRLFKDPYPISETFFLAAHKPKGLPWHDPKGYDLTLLDEQGNGSTLYRDEEISCWHPYPLVTRPIPPRTVTSVQPNLAEKNLAHCIVTDVYAGLNGVEKNTVKHLRIMEQTPRPWTARNRWKGDQEGMAHTTLGPYILGMHAQHGIIPVNTDGSASFYVPAGRNIYFQLLDENYMAIQTERTYINYMPGETRSCVGCHERSRTGKTAAMPVASALKREPVMPGPQPGDSSGQKLFDYERQIQPIWNKYCIKCHDSSDKAPEKLDLTGGLTRLYCNSYENLLGIGDARSKQRKFTLVGVQANENDIRANVEYMPPYYYGAYSSILAATFGQFEPHFEQFGNNASKMSERVKALREKHKDTKLQKEEFIRIVNWLDASCQYYGSYWGMKNLSHSNSPHFRPDVRFEDALADIYPSAMRTIYDLPANR